MKMGHGLVLVLLLWSSSIHGEESMENEIEDKNFNDLFNNAQPLENISVESSGEIDTLIEKNRFRRSISDHALSPRPKRKSGIKCTIRRYENVYFYGQLAEVVENVQKLSNCAYLCWKKRNDVDKQCSSVNYLSKKQRCELMQDTISMKDIILSLINKVQGSEYVIPVNCGDGNSQEASNPSLPDFTTASPNDIFGYNPNRRGSCGQSKVRSRIAPAHERIVGGAEARPHSHPWIVSLQRNGQNHFCGGTLIRASNSGDRSDIVVTAAHCVRGASNFQVVAGLHSLRRSTGGEKRIGVKRIISHPSYSSRTQQNDIAIIVLDSPIQFSSTIQPVCLPSQGEQISESASVYVAGWGLLRENGSPSSSLMEVIVPIVGARECAANYGSRLPIYSQQMVCAGVKGKDSCQGDSGGPMTLRTGSGFVLHGVVSFGEGCARAKKPGVYARVPTYVDWINQQIRSSSSVRN